MLRACPPQCPPGFLLAVRYAVPEMRAFLSKLHAKGQYWVPIVDAGVAKAKGYLSYEEGVKDGVFVKNYKGGEYMGQGGYPRA